MEAIEALALIGGHVNEELGLRTLTMLRNIQLISTYHPSQALNRKGFPEGFSYCRSDLIRYTCPWGLITTTQRVASMPM